MTSEEYFVEADFLYKEKKYEDSLSLYNEAINGNSKNTEFYKGKVCALLRLKRFKEALETCDVAISIQENDPKTWMLKGHSLYNLNNFEEALESYELSIKLDPKNTKIWNSKGNALFRLTNYEEALFSYEKSIQLDENNAYPWNGKGSVLNALNRYEEALEAFNKAIHLDPKDAYPWNGKGIALHELKRNKEALEAYDISIELDPEYAIPWNGKGIVLRDQKRYEEALKAYDRAIEIDPNYPSPWNGKGIVYKDLELYEKALEMYDTSIKLSPNFALPWIGKGNISLALKRYNEAQLTYNIAIQLDSNQSVFWHNKGLIYGYQKEYYLAKQCFQKADKLSPGSIWEDLLSDETLINYFKALEKEGGQNLYEGKILIVGEGGAGKTTLVEKLIDPNYHVPSTNGISTQGIDIRTYQFDYDIGKEKKKIKANIWDFGGQEIYLNTHQLFLTNDSLYLLVVDNRREDANFEYWLYIVSLLGHNSPILIILNEKDEWIKNVDFTQLKSNFPSLQRVIPVNFRDNFGLEALKEAIHYHLQQLSIVGKKIPTTWLELRRSLEKEHRDHITFEDLSNICKKYRISEKAQVRSVSEFLHNLGIIIHYQDDIELEDVVILNPEWATKAVYAVLKDKEIIKQGGRFSLEQVRSLWHPKYPRERHRELLHLMIRFYLCYPIDGTKEFIAPDLLPLIQPKYPFPSVSLLEFQFHYDLMPKGILSRFIVLTHQMIKNGIVWKSGVLLASENTEAEVKQNLRTRKISIRIHGSKSKELLYYIRENLRIVHNKFPGLKYRECIPCPCEECSLAKEPEYFTLDYIERAINKGKNTVECRKLCDDIPISVLIEPIDIFKIDLKRIEALIARGELEKGIKLLRDGTKDSPLYQNVIQISGRFTKFHQDKIEGVISYEQQQIELNKLTKNVQDIIKQVERSNFF